MNIIDFYLDKKNKSGYTYSNIVFTWSDEEWEDRHDFIQWVFPIDTTSQFNPNAPLLDAELIKEIHSNIPLLKVRVCMSLKRFCDFIGIKYTYECSPRDNMILLDEEKFQNKVLTPNHNCLRITRCLRCLTLLSLKEPRDQFFNILKQYKDQVDPETFDYWEKACHK